MDKVAWAIRAAVVHNSAVYVGVIVIVTVMIVMMNVGLAAVIRGILG
jgi:hypothetical protein